jgi:hypothetical protein
MFGDDDDDDYDDVYFLWRSIWIFKDLLKVKIKTW